MSKDGDFNLMVQCLKKVADNFQEVVYERRS